MKPDGAAGSTSNGGERYRFGQVEVDVPAHTLSRGGQPQALEPKAFAVLIALLRRPGELLGREELLDEVWGHRHVTPGVLTRAIAQLRGALEDDVQQPRYIQTRHALGYRFIGELESGQEPEPQIVAPIPMPAPADDDAVMEAAAVAVPPVVARETAIATDVLPYAGDERRDPHDAMHPHWQWPAIGVVMVVLMAAAWGMHQRYFVVPVRPAEPSIAVLPFTTLSDDSNDRYFAEGLSVEMLNALAGEPGLIVAAWQPPEAVDRRMDTQTLGKRLGVATLLDASVRREGKRLRIDARLSDTASGTTLWSRSFDGRTEAVFDTQREIAHQVVKALLGVLPNANTGLDRRLAPTRNAAAFDAYLLGLYQLINSDKDKPANAVDSFRRALVHDAGFARAQAGLCRAELLSFESNRDAEAFARARVACLRAQNMDQGIGEVALALGDLYRVKGDLERASGYYSSLKDDPAMRAAGLIGLAEIDVERNLPDQAMDKFRRALQASPGDADVYAQMGYQQYVLGRLKDALASYRRVVELRPDSAEYWGIYGSLLQVAGESDASARALERSVGIEPSEAAVSNLGTLKYQRGDYRGAADLYRQAIDINPGNFLIKGNLGDALLAEDSDERLAKDAFAKAAGQAEAYLRIDAGDAPSMAALAWYLANLGQPEKAMALVARSEAISPKQADVAVFNAETLALLGRNEEASRRIAIARAAGASEARISTNAIFRRYRLVSPPAAPAENVPRK